MSEDFVESDDVGGGIGGEDDEVGSEMLNGLARLRCRSGRFGGIYFIWRLRGFGR